MLFPMLRRPAIRNNGHRFFSNDFVQMQRDLNKLFATSVSVSQTSAPAIEFFKSGAGFVIRANVAGVTPEVLEISVLGKQLTISGEYQMRQDEDVEPSYSLRERREGTFSRTLTLPQNIDPEKVEATFDNGVVEIRLPLAASEQPRRIEIGLSKEG